ncbi:uncharacterized protein [Narcine bancroftii]|uniref:uncharacterized protein n=1 Tax=Narcine bancroftii TaxID=1343680 RepID=UPI003831AE69
MEMTSWSLLLILFHNIHTVYAVVFRVAGPEYQIVAMFGKTAVLECQLIPDEPLPGMEIRWMRSDTKAHATVHVYRSDHNVPEEQSADYAGRTELFINRLNKGNVSLKLNDVQLRDEGDYLCMVEHQRIIEEVHVPLKVASLGLQPAIQLAGYQGNGIRIHCKSSGWYPVPKLLWGVNNNNNSQNEMDESQVHKDLDGFYHISRSIDIMRGTIEVKCTVQSTLLNDQLVSIMRIPDEFFPSPSKFFIMFMVILVALILVVSGAAWYYYRKRMDAKELFKRPTINEHEMLMNAIDKLETLIANAQHNFDLEKTLSTEAPERVLAASVRVTFDPDTANPYLAVSEDCLSVSFQEEWKPTKEDSECFTARLFVMAKEGYNTGCQYWEVWVGNKPDWDLGVAVENIPKKEWVSLSPSNGIWTIGRRSLTYEVNNDEPEMLTGIAMAQIIGIYLDHSTCSVHFYNAEVMSHIYTFRVKFTGKLYPFFSPWGSEEIMRIFDRVMKKAKVILAFINRGVGFKSHELTLPPPPPYFFDLNYSPLRSRCPNHGPSPLVTHTPRPQAACPSELPLLQMQTHQPDLSIQAPSTLNDAGTYHSQKKDANAFERVQEEIYQVVAWIGECGLAQYLHGANNRDRTWGGSKTERPEENPAWEERTNSLQTAPDLNPVPPVLIDGHLLRMEIQRSFFCRRAANLWNLLWQSVVEAESAGDRFLISQGIKGYGEKDRAVGLSGKMDQLVIKLQGNPDWVNELPWVLLGTCSMPKEDLQVSTARTQTRHTAISRPQQAAFCRVRFYSARPTRSTSAETVRGPYKIVQRPGSTFTLDIGGRRELFTVDRLKPAHLDPTEPVVLMIVAQPKKRYCPAKKDNGAGSVVGGGGGGAVWRHNTRQANRPKWRRRGFPLLSTGLRSLCWGTTRCRSDISIPQRSSQPGRGWEYKSSPSPCNKSVLLTELNPSGFVFFQQQWSCRYTAEGQPEDYLDASPIQTLAPPRLCPGPKSRNSKAPRKRFNVGNLQSDERPDSLTRFAGGGGSEADPLPPSVWARGPGDAQPHLHATPVAVVSGFGLHCPACNARDGNRSESQRGAARPSELQMLRTSLVPRSKEQVICCCYRLMESEQMEACRLICILFWISSTPSGALDQLVVRGPLDPIVAVVGEDVVLDCQLVIIGNKIPDNMELHWINVALSYTSPVHTYMGGADDLSQQAPAYKGRTHLFSEQISQGNLSLKLSDVQVSDNGQYKCLVTSKPIHEEVKMTLNVVGRGNQPWIEMVDYVSNGIRLACLSEGWFPKPDIQWMNEIGNNVTEQMTATYREGSHGLYVVRSTVVVNSANAYFCRMSTKGLGQPGLQVCIQIPEQFFPRISGWLTAFVILLCLVIAAIVFVLWSRHKLVKEIKALKNSASFIENTILRNEIDEQKWSAEAKIKSVRDKQEKEKNVIKAEHEMQLKNLADKMKIMEAEYKKLANEVEQWRPLIKSEWDRMRSHSVAVHLDPRTANGSLEVSVMRVSGRKGQPLTVPDVPERFDSVPYMLSLEGFATGAHFWEVEVSSKAYWDIGVASESVERKGIPNLSSDAGFWTLGRDGEQYTVSDKSHSIITMTGQPTRIGVFLDMEAARVSFYNADTMFHLYTFNASFSGKIHPFFAPGWSETPLIICPIES